VSNDTDSIPGEDLRDLLGDPPNYVHGLLIVWSLEEWKRIGEVMLFELLAHWVSVGRDADSPGGYRRAQCVRQRPGEHVVMPPLATRTCSGDQLLVRATATGLEIQNVGKNPMIVNGKVVTRCVLEPGQLMTLAGQFLFMCVRRPLPMPPWRHFDPRHLGPFGEPNAFGAIGEGEEAYRLMEQLAFAAQSGDHVLLLGESGTGKDACGRAIHAMSPSAPGPFVPISAGNLERSLLVDQLFGHRKGYPESTMEESLGAIGEAHGGSLFFDEIGRLALDAQGALLRVLDQGQYKQLGGKGVKYSLFKLIGAMSSPIDSLLLDLRQRLIRKIWVPRLVDRREDIALIVRGILKKKHAENPDLTRHLVRKQADGSEEVVPPVMFIEKMLSQEAFEGNVRGLQEAVGEMLFESKPAQQGGVVLVRDQGDGEGEDEARGSRLTKAEMEAALGRYAGRVSAAARELGVTRQSLYRAMERVGVKAKGGEGPR